MYQSQNFVSHDIKWSQRTPTSAKVGVSTGALVPCWWFSGQDNTILYQLYRHSYTETSCLLQYTLPSTFIPQTPISPVETDLSDPGEEPRLLSWHSTLFL